MSKKVSRRKFLQGFGLAAAGAAVAACQPQTVIVEKEVEKVVKETVVVETEKEVEKVVKETVVVEKEKVVKETVVVKEQVEVRVQDTGLPWQYSPIGSPNNGEPITFSYWDWHQPRIDMMERWFPKYSDLYPNAQFEITNTPFSDYWTKAKAAIPAGEAPDLMYFHQGYGNFQTFVWGGLLEAFPEDMFPPTEMKDTFTSLSAWLGPKDQIYWIPTGAMSEAIYYNKDMFEEVGLTGEDIPITWDDLVVFAKELTQYDSAGRVDISGFDTNGYEMSTWQFRWKNYGKWLWDEDYRYPCYAQEEIIETLQWFVDLREKHKIVDLDFLGWMDAFGSGKAFMVPGWSWFTGWMNVNQPQVNYGVRRIPSIDGDFPPCAGPGSADPQSIVVPVTNPPERKMAALDVIAFLYSNPEFLIDNSLTLGSPPVTPQILNSPLLMSDETVSAITPQAEWLTFGGGGAPTGGDILNKWLRDGIFVAGGDVTQNVLSCQEELNAATDEYREEVGEENFIVTEREYLHADMMSFGECMFG
jgi:multiple sugar transport system substrate-binding protein